MLLCRCPCVEGICLEAHECPDSHKYPAPNNECLLRTMLLDARVPTKEHRFNFSIVKNYRGRAAPCVPPPYNRGSTEYLGSTAKYSIRGYI